MVTLIDCFCGILQSVNMDLPKWGDFAVEMKIRYVKTDKIKLQWQQETNKRKSTENLPWNDLARESEQK